MKLLKEFHTTSEAEELNAHMRKQGVLTFIANSNTKRLGAIGAGPQTVGVWVVVNEQYADAAQLLKNPDHQVSSPLSEAAMIEIEGKAIVHGRTTLFNSTMKWLTLAAVLVVVSWIGFSIYG